MLNLLTKCRYFIHCIAQFLLYGIYRNFGADMMWARLGSFYNGCRMIWLTDSHQLISLFSLIKTQPHILSQQWRTFQDILNIGSEGGASAWNSHNGRSHEIKQRKGSSSELFERKTDEVLYYLIHQIKMIGRGLLENIFCTLWLCLYLKLLILMF